MRILKNESEAVDSVFYFHGIFIFYVLSFRKGGSFFVSRIDKPDFCGIFRLQRPIIPLESLSKYTRRKS